MFVLSLFGSSILGAILFTLIYGVIFLYDSQQKNRLTCLLMETLSRSPNRIVDDILYSANDAKVDIEINRKNEYKVFVDIISQYQSYLSDAFWHDRISYKSKSCHLTSDMYFLFWFEMYLLDHYCDRVFNGSDMHRVISSKRQILDGDSIEETINSLTDYGLAFMKLCYMTCFLAESDKKVLSLLAYNRFAPRIKSILEDGQIELVSGIRY